MQQPKQKIEAKPDSTIARLRRAQPGGLTGHQPRVERFVRHPGLETIRENAPRRWCEDYLGQQWSMTAEYVGPPHLSALTERRYKLGRFG